MYCSEWICTYSFLLRFLFFLFFNKTFEDSVTCSVSGSRLCDYGTISVRADNDSGNCSLLFFLFLFLSKFMTFSDGIFGTRAYTNDKRTPFDDDGILRGSTRGAALTRPKNGRTPSRGLPHHRNLPRLRYMTVAYMTTVTRLPYVRERVCARDIKTVRRTPP